MRMREPVGVFPLHILRMHATVGLCLHAVVCYMQSLSWTKCLATNEVFRRWGKHVEAETQLGCEEYCKVLISRKYTHWKNVMLLVTEIPTPL
jgi:hypothetical protein